jgi:hypothetical protein
MIPRYHRFVMTAKAQQNGNVHRLNPLLQVCIKSNKTQVT